MGLFKQRRHVRDTPSGLVTVSRSDPIAIIRINNAAHTNVLTKNLVSELTAAFVAISADWRAGKHLTDVIEEARQPVICAIQGSCVSVGLAVALACDIRLAAENARLSFPDVRHIQLVPGWGATQRLVFRFKK